VAFPRTGQATPAEAADLRRRLAELFREHHDRLVRFLTLRLSSRAEAQEAAQEAYVRLLQRPALKPDDNFRALLYVTARNLAIDRLRERGRRDVRETPAWSEEDVRTPERILAGKQLLGRIELLIAELPPKCRYAFIRYKFYGAEYAEIATELRLTESMVRKYVLRALAHCASRLDPQEDLR
jgi:RNA polymerase sigma-70 factor (ECF subfamily)